MKIPKVTIYYGIAVVIIVLVILLLSGPTNGVLDYYGFALDSHNNLYLGSNGKIQVFDDQGNADRIITPPTNRKYTFSIIDDKIIVIGTKISTLDLNGNLLNKEEINVMKHGMSPSFPENYFVDGDGNEYVMRSPWLRTGVYDQSHNMMCIWEMPISSYISRLLGVVLFTSWFIFLPIIIIKCRKLNPPVKWW